VIASGAPVDAQGKVRMNGIIGTVFMLLLATAVVPPPVAAAGKWSRRQARLASCPRNRTLARTDTKACPATKRRPAITMRRACCYNPNGRLVCKPFGPCPPRSPS